MILTISTAKSEKSSKFQIITIKPWSKIWLQIAQSTRPLPEMLYMYVSLTLNANSQFYDPALPSFPVPTEASKFLAHTAIQR